MNQDGAVPLVCGDPTKGPASYTLFILPFGYHPQPLGSGVPMGPSYTRIADTEATRAHQHYFTLETAQALFKRAEWLRLSGKWEATYDLVIGSRRIPASLSRPMLVLFEWKHHESRPHKDRGEREPDPLSTGFLILELFFPDAASSPSLDDFLRINEHFRYFVRPFREHEKRFRNLLQEWPVDLLSPTQKIGATAPSFQDGQTNAYSERWLRLLEVPVHHGTAFRLFPESWGRQARHWLTESNIVDLRGAGCLVYADNRAFTWTCAIVKEGGRGLSNRFGDGQKITEAEEFGHWVRLLNVDWPGDTPVQTHQDISQFEKNWARERTYKRWQSGGTWFGFTSHSGALLAAPCQLPDIGRHFRHIYFHQCLLLFYIRVCLFRLSTMLFQATATVRDHPKANLWNVFERLLWDFSMFTNLYQFPLISNQQQAVEMYSQLRSAMDIDDLFDEVEKEIKSTHEFLLQDRTFEEAQTVTRLTVVATAGLILATAFGFLGMNLIVGLWADSSLSRQIPIVILAVMAALAFFVLIIWGADWLYHRIIRLANAGGRSFRGNKANAVSSPSRSRQL